MSLDSVFLRKSPLFYRIGDGSAAGYWLSIDLPRCPMKEIRAYLQPYVLRELLVQLLEEPGFPGVSVLDCMGIGTEKLATIHQFDPLFPRKRLELIVPDDLVDTMVAIIIKHAYTGNPNDGRIFIMDVQDSIQISTHPTLPSA